jgi:adenylate cyclase
MIDRFFVGATRAVAEEDGLVESLTGDAVAAFWGAGFAGKDYVTRTIHAAQGILRRMAVEQIPVGVGVHAGLAYFGAMGSTDSRIDISAIGEEVNTAARLASKAAAGEIIVSEAALAKTNIDGAGLEARSLDLKGISQPVAARVMHA